MARIDFNERHAGVVNAADTDAGELSALAARIARSACLFFAAMRLPGR
jgi:hypothetical protein